MEAHLAPSADAPRWLGNEEIIPGFESGLPVWSPQNGPQLDAIGATWCEELFYGGAAGGGKSDYLLGDFLQDVFVWGPWWRGILFRRTYAELEDLVQRSMEIFPQTGAKWNEQKHEWKWPNGAYLRMRYLERDKDRTRYQGHQYCVAAGTPIRMADGTFRPIEQIKVGDKVATLEGARQVTATIALYRAPCVRADVFDARGEAVGSQVHPVWHPVLSSEGWLSFSADDRSDGRASSRSHQGARRLHGSCGSVTLHAPTIRSARRASPDQSSPPTARHARGRSVPPLSASTRATRSTASDQSRLQELERSAPGLVGRWWTNALACARRAMSAARDLMARCPSVFDYRDERALAWSGSGQARTPSRGDAEALSRASRPGGSDTIPTHSHLGPSCWEHPYSGEARHLAEEVEQGFVELSPCGDAMVCDLTVEGANHYISACGLVNKNTWIGWDELTQWPTDKAYRYLRARLRSRHPVTNKRIRAAANPGGVGHHWVKQYFIAPARGGYVPIYDKIVKHQRMFIPAKLSDNKILLKNDPDYEARLSGLGSDAEVKAWRDGDWDVVEGAYFDCWSVKMILRPFQIPDEWVRFRSMDWGSASPFSVGWWAVVQDDYTTIEGYVLPRGAMVRYREWYGAKPLTEASTLAGRGLKLTAEQVGAGIVRREKEDPKLGGGVLDPSAFDEDGGPSLAERINGELIKAKLIPFRKADNKRATRMIGSSDKRGPMGGWDQMRQRMMGKLGDSLKDRRPMIYCFDTCADSIRTIPLLQHDPAKVEDVDTNSEDHNADEWRYACLSRPYLRPDKVKEEPVDAYRETREEPRDYGESIKLL